MVADYPVCLLEDGLAESDWEGWKLLNRRLGAPSSWSGDDIFCTNPAIIARGIEEDIANSTLIKLNQIGTLTETIAATRLAAVPRLGRLRVPPFRGDGRQLHRRHDRGPGHRSPQDGSALPR